MTRGRKVAAGVALAVLVAAGAFAAYRRATSSPDPPITALTPVDAQRAIATRSAGGGRDRISLVDGTGRAAWSREVEDAGALAVDPAAGFVVVGDAEALDLQRGDERWRRTGASGPGLRALHLDRGMLLGARVQGEGSDVFALDAASGRSLWHTESAVGNVVFYHLFDDTLLVVDRPRGSADHATLLERRTGAPIDPRLPDTAPGMVCTTGPRAYLLTPEGALVLVDLATRSRVVASPDLGHTLCPTPCGRLACATHRDEVVLAAGQGAAAASLPTTIRIAAVDAASHAVRATIDLPAPAGVHARSEMTFRDFVPLGGQAPRFVPFRVGGDLVVVDLDRHEVASRGPARDEGRSGWALLRDGDVYHAHDHGTVGVFDGARGTIAAAARLAVGNVKVADGALWVFGTTYGEERPVEAVGRLDARTLKPLPGSERLVEERTEGGWPARSGWSAPR